MTARERILAALERRPTDLPAVGNAVSIATVELMDATGCAFPEAHQDPEMMAGLAAAGFEILGYDTIAPVFSVQHEADALGCKVDWGRRDTMPDCTIHPCRSVEDIQIRADVLRHPSMVVPCDALRLLRQRYPDVALVGKVFGPWTLACHLSVFERLLMIALHAPFRARRTKEQ
ncbi:MAG: MtaA/CmuA family methyltransferase, partial [Armatimonadetes bacterium]|nr:MtaA/CmuA family methyltransferase [Armatimonadota bacterium]